jgi:hypothetical protein
MTARQERICLEMRTGSGPSRRIRRPLAQERPKRIPHGRGLDTPLEECPVWHKAAWSTVPFPFPLITSAEILEAYAHAYGIGARWL